MSGFTARPTATHWVVPGIGAAALHAVALLLGLLELRSTPALAAANTAELTFETEVEAANEAANEVHAPEDTDAARASTTRSDVERAAATLATALTLPHTSRTAPTKTALSKLEPSKSESSKSEPSKSEPSKLAAATAQNTAPDEPNPSRERALTDAMNTSADARDGAASFASANATGPASNGAADPNTAHGLHAKTTGPNAHSAGSMVTKPRLVSSGAACQGVLNSSLTAPTKVTLVLQVGKDGSALPTSVRAESNAQVPGLELAAQRCAQRLRFLPARAPDGSAVTAASVIKLTFSNHYTATLPRVSKRRHGAI